MSSVKDILIKKTGGICSNEWYIAVEKEIIKAVNNMNSQDKDVLKYLYDFMREKEIPDMLCCSIDFYNYTLSKGLLIKKSHISKVFRLVFKKVPKPRIYNNFFKFENRMGHPYIIQLPENKNKTTLNC